MFACITACNAAILIPTKASFKPAKKSGRAISGPQLLHMTNQSAMFEPDTRAACHFCMQKCINSRHKNRPPSRWGPGQKPVDALHSMTKEFLQGAACLHVRCRYVRVTPSGVASNGSCLAIGPFPYERDGKGRDDLDLGRCGTVPSGCGTDQGMRGGA